MRQINRFGIHMNDATIETNSKCENIEKNYSMIRNFTLLALHSFRKVQGLISRYID